jgi:hypothetical protein
MSDKSTTAGNIPAAEQVKSDDGSGDSLVHQSTQKDSHPREIGGRAGPDPTRYGDWEKAGRCIDF